MTLASIPNNGMIQGGDIVVGGNALTLDVLDEFWGAIFKIPKTGTLKKIGFFVYSTVTLSGTLRAALENIDATSQANPLTATPNLYNANGYGDQTTFSANTTLWTALNGADGISVTKDDVVAATARITACASGALSFIVTGTSPIKYFPNAYLYTGTGSWGTGGWPKVGLEYSDGMVRILGCEPPWYTNTISYNTGSSPDRYGSRFSIPFPATMSGVMVYCDPDVDANILIYDSDGVTVLQTIVIDKDVRGSTNVGPLYIPLTTPINLSKDTYYRIVLTSSGVTNIGLQYYFGNNTASYYISDLYNFIGTIHGTKCSGTPANEASWTQDTAKIYQVIPCFSAFDDGAGAGGGGLLTHPGMSGGMRG